MKYKSKLREEARKLFPYIYAFKLEVGTLRILFNRKNVNKVDMGKVIKYIEDILFTYKMFNIHTIILENCKTEKLTFQVPKEVNYYMITLSNSKIDSIIVYNDKPYTIALKGETTINIVVKPNIFTIQRDKKKYRNRVTYYNMYEYVSKNINDVGRNYMQIASI